jgi:hypothetical protein
MTHPSGIDPIEIAEHFGFNVGTAIGILFRDDAVRPYVSPELCAHHYAQARPYIERAIAADQWIHWPTQIESKLSRVLACDESPLVRVLRELVGRGPFHVTRVKDLRRALQVLDDEIAKAEREAM